MKAINSVERNIHTPVMDSLRCSIITTMERVLSEDKPPPTTSKDPIVPPAGINEGNAVTLGRFKFKQSARKETPRENKDEVIQVARRPYRAHRDRIREVLQA